MTRASRQLPLVLLLGCTEPDTSRTHPPDRTAPTTTDTAPVGDTSDTGAPTDTAPTDTTPVFDCSTVPLEPISVTPVEHARGYHDLLFDGERIIGSDGSSLLSVAPDGDIEVLVPNVGVIQQIDRLPSGDLVYADSDDATLKTVTPEGAVSTLTSDLAAYGVRVGPDGFIYIASFDIVRVDPSTGEREIMVPGEGREPRVLTFNRDYTKLYFGTSRGNHLWWVDLDENLEPSESRRCS